MTTALNKLSCFTAYGAHKREGPADDVDDSNVNSCKLVYFPGDSSLSQLFHFAAYGAHKREGPADDVDDSNVGSCKLVYLPDDGCLISSSTLQRTEPTNAKDPLMMSTIATSIAVSRYIFLTTIALNQPFFAAYAAHKREGPADDVDDSNVGSCKLVYFPPRRLRSMNHSAFQLTEPTNVKGPTRMLTTATPPTVSLSIHLPDSRQLCVLNSWDLSAYHGN